MARRWLVKSDPDQYGFDDLLRDGRTEWDGVRNAVACRHLAAMCRGDAVLVYHSGKEKAVVGTATVGRTDLTNPELLAQRRLPRPVPLAELRGDERLASSPLLRMPRLSVMPLTAAEWNAVMGRARNRTAGPRRDVRPSAAATKKPRERA